MKRFLMPLGLALVALSLLSAGAPARAEDRPLKAAGAGYVYSLFFESLFGEGPATHLGRSSLGVELTFEDYLYSSLFWPTGSAYLRSASGDVLYFDFDEDIYYVDQVTGVVSTTVTFTGGTGRFQNARGSADVIFDFDQDFYNFSFRIDGSIDY